MYHRRDDVDRYLEMWGQLAVCLVMDFIGVASYLLPVAGELADIVFAPLEALWIWWMLDGHPRSAGAWSTFGFAEEIIPGITDWIPANTAAWIFKYQFRK